MRIIKYTLLTVFCLTLANCKTEERSFPLDKRYWDVQDYDNAVLELRFGYKDDEKLPTFDNLEKRIIVEKLTDHQNYKVVLDDKELGLKHRNDVATKFFNQYRDMTQIYMARDRKDNYRYDKEMLAVEHFGLGLQLKYFKLGNDQIIESSDDPNSSRVKNTINSNVNTLIKNYLIYLDEINNENAFTEEGKSKLAEGIDEFFTELIELYPNANYSGMLNKAKLMLKKSQSDKIKSSLTKLIELINSKRVKE